MHYGSDDEDHEFFGTVHHQAARLYFRGGRAMADDTDLPTVDEVLHSTLMELNAVRGKLRKVASHLQFDRRPVGSPPTPAQSRARVVTLGALDDAKAAIDRATGALDDALHTDDPPRP